MRRRNAHPARSCAVSLAAALALTACLSSPGLHPPASLSAPSDVTVTPGRDTLTVAWTPVEGATGYAIYWAMGSYDPPPGSRQTTSGATSFTLRGLGPGMRYSVAVAATDAVGEGPWSRTVSAQTGSAPPLVTAHAGDGAVLVTWEREEEGGTSFSFSRAEADATGELPANPSWVSVAGPTGSQRYAVDTNVVNGKTYFYRTTGSSTRDSAAVPATPTQGKTGCATLPATAVTATSAKLHGILLNPPGRSSTATFEHGDTEALGASTGVAVTGAAGPAAFSLDVRSLPDDTQLHYRFVVENADGTCAGTARVIRTWRAPQVLASGLPASGPLASAIPLALGPDAVYVGLDGLALGPDRIARIPKSGGAPEHVADANAPAALAWHDSALYVADAGGVRRIDPAAPSVTTLFGGTVRLEGHVLDVAGASLHWRHYLDGVYALPLAGGTPAIVVPAAELVAWAGSVDADETGIYWSEASSIWKVPLEAPGALPALVSQGAGEFVVGNGFLYFLESPASATFPALRRISVSGGDAQLLAYLPWGIGRPLAVDARHVYLATGNLVLRVPVEGGAATTLAYSDAVNAPDRGAFALDDTHVYWVVRDGSSDLRSVVRISKD